MQRIYLVWFLLFAALSLQAGETPDFRQSRWGDSLEQVKAKEASKLEYEVTNKLGYTDTLAGLEFNLSYRFTSNKLTMGFYSLAKRHMNATDYVSDFKAIKELLVKKYGQPQTDDTIWKNDMFKDRPDDWGTAVAYGQMEMMAEWANDGTTIRLRLVGDNMKVTLGLGYWPGDQMKVEKEKREQEDLNKL